MASTALAAAAVVVGAAVVVVEHPPVEGSAVMATEPLPAADAVA